MTDLPKSVQAQIDEVRTRLEELAGGRWDQRESKSGGSRLRSIAARVVNAAKDLELLVKENTFP